jgi:hypothetical protein
MRRGRPQARRRLLIVDDEGRGIANWLSSTGYPLEHRAAEALRKVGYIVEPSVRYVGTHGTARETDLIADEPEVSGGVEVRMVVECKHNDRPWIVRIAPPSPRAIDHVRDLLMHVDALSPLAQEAGAFADRASLGRGRVGFTIIEGPQTERQERKDQDRERPYAALQAVTAAARAVPSSKSVYDSLWVILPVIVIDGSLWKLGFAPTAEPRRVQWQKVRWAGGEGASPILIDVVTEATLDQFLEQRRSDTRWLAGWLGGRPPRGPMIA